MNFVLLGYAYSEGGVTADPSVPLTNADIQIHATFLGYARSLDLWGLSGKFAAVLPYAWLSGTADFMGQPREREVSGFGDPKLQLSVNFYGAPALSLKEFADNDDFLGGRTREQDPLYSVQAHVIYSFPRGIWAALDGTYYVGGRTTIDGVKSDDRQENSRVGATVSFPVSRHNSVKVYGSTGATARTGTKFTTVGAAWQFRWGGGL
jgi:hypothetical protein